MGPPEIKPIEKKAKMNKRINIKIDFKILAKLHFAMFEHHTHMFLELYRGFG